MVNSFKGALTELLAAGACQRLMRDVRLVGRLPAGARLYVEDLESAAKTLATVRKRPASKRKGGKRHS
jgi:hypothetical protein